MIEPEQFAFCERASGQIRFLVRATARGEMPIEEAASLLAMHCLVRGDKPSDYMVLAVPRRDLLPAVAPKAEQLLLAAATAAGSSVRLSQRQREVLECVLQNLPNKEIGVRLHVTERTIKFHVSRLLAKFKVHDRSGLKHAAAAACYSKTDGGSRALSTGGTPALHGSQIPCVTPPSPVL